MGITKKMIIKEKKAWIFYKILSNISLSRKRMEISPQKLYMDIGA